MESYIVNVGGRKVRPGQNGQATDTEELSFNLEDFKIKKEV